MGDNDTDKLYYEGQGWEEVASLRIQLAKAEARVEFAKGWIRGLPNEPSEEDKNAALKALEKTP